MHFVSSCLNFVDAAWGHCIGLSLYYALSWHVHLVTASINVPDVAQCSGVCCSFLTCSCDVLSFSEPSSPTLLLLFSGFLALYFPSQIYTMLLSLSLCSHWSRLQPQTVSHISLGGRAALCCLLLQLLSWNVKSTLVLAY